jgi:hypothetical protein
MKSVTVSHRVHKPEVVDYEEIFPRVLCNTPNKQSIFELITNPENIIRAITISEETGSSPIVVYESKISNAVNDGEISPLNWHEKQFVGAVTRVVMESNGWAKTGKKQRFSKGIFKSAEIYIKSENYATTIG